MIHVRERRVDIDTRTLTATFGRGVLVSPVRNRDGARLVEPTAGVAPLSLVYAHGEVAALGGEPGDDVACVGLGEHHAQVRVHAWHGDGLLDLREDPANGDLVVEPSGYAARPGLRAVRWPVRGIGAGLDLVAPFFQGTRLPLEDDLLRDSHWAWPQWEAGLAILQGATGGFWIHTRDPRYRFKALHVGAAGTPRGLGFDTESYGPLDARLAAGGLAWRLNVHDGGWESPADAYRAWLESTWQPPPRPAWTREVTFAVSWCPTDPDLLDALATHLEPPRVLLHVPGWRCDPYDENYPDFVAGDAGRAFVAKAQAMGFVTLPHFNAIDMDPTHPLYDRVRDFQYRDLESRHLQGWTWIDGTSRPVPESNAARLRHRDKKTMIKVHPGLSTWRSLLTERVHAAARRLPRRDPVHLEPAQRPGGLARAADIADPNPAVAAMLELTRR